MKKLFLEDYANMTGEDLPLSQDDIFSLSEKMDKAEDWLKEQKEAQSEKLAHEDPAFKVVDVSIKERTLYNAGETLVKKIKYWKPPKPTEPPKPAKNETDEVEINADDEHDENKNPDEDILDSILEDETGDEKNREKTPEGDPEPEPTEKPEAEIPEPSTHDPTDL